MEEKENKLHLEYPCAWIYKIIGTDEDEMRMGVNEIIQDRTVWLRFPAAAGTTAIAVSTWK
mgnify:CR=1 FL=1